MTHGAKELAALLPKEPPKEMQHWVWTDCRDALGGDLCIFRRESVTAYDEAGILQTMGPEDWENYEATKKTMWGARCTCTACHEDFITGYISKGKYGVASGIEIMQGEDGAFYEGVPAMEDEHCWRADTIQIGETDHFACPFCGQDLCLTRSSDLRHGKTYQLLVNSIAVIDGYLVLLYWMARRCFWDWGVGEQSIRPREAIVLGGNGKQVRYICDAVTGWRVATKAVDPARKKYHSVEAASHNKINALIWPVMPDLCGSTGEKTGIGDYIDAGGMWLATYLALWRRHRNVENLVRHGWGYTLGTAMDEAVMNQLTGQIGREIEMRWISWEETKPHRMLGMSKEDFKASKTWGWPWQIADAWRQYSYYTGECTAAQFDAYRRLLKDDGLQRIVGMVMDGWELPLGKVVRYLQKQAGGHPEIAVLARQFIDYREMLDAVGGTPTEEELWPRHLVAAHDRLAAIAADGDKAMYKKGMAEIAEKLAPLAWSDGKYCVRVAATPTELTNEGRVLEHCVGTYHKKHCAKTDVIFFVRRARKPNTPYFTLDINMTLKIPKEVQLHGYKNEWCKQGGRRHIPAKVRAFCDRWENEVLLPWFAAHRDMAQPEEKKRRKARKEHIA